MLKEFEKLQTISKKIDRLLLKGLGLMLILILVAGLNSYSDTANNTSITNSLKPENIEYKNCITNKKTDYQKPEPALKTNTSKSLIDIVTDTETAGVTKGEIIAITHPEFINFDKADNCIKVEESVYSFIYNQTVRIYPKSILRHHQLIHDQVDGENFLVTYSPFSDSANIYRRNAEEFGISGRIFKGNNLIYDLKTESLWLEFNGKAVAGDKIGTILTKLILRESTYEKAKAAFPNADIMSFDNGYGINYATNPYSNFEKTTLPFGNIDSSNYEIEPRERGLSFEINKKSYFYAFSEIPLMLSQTNEFRITKNQQLDSYEVGIADLEGNIQTIPYTYSYFYSYKEIRDQLQKEN